MQDKRKDIQSAIVFFLFGIFLYVGSYWIPPTTSDILGSRFFPRVVAILIGILSVAQFLGAMSGLKQAKAAPEKKEEAQQEKEEFNKPFVLTIVALFAYYFLIRVVGFTITSILYLVFEGFVLMTKSEMKNKKQVAIVLIVAVVVPVFLNWIFWNVFSIKLPVGSLFE